MGVLPAFGGKALPPMTATSLSKDGFEIHRGIFKGKDLTEFREEAAAVAQAAGSICVRHLRAKSGRFDALSTSQLVLSMLPPNLRPVRSILFDKTSSENWPVPWHQDLTIAVAAAEEVDAYGPWSYKDGAPHVQPPVSLLENMVTVRIHLDETPASNGALRVIPGSHRKGKLSAESVVDQDKGMAVTCECHAGDVLLMSPLILHSSRRSELPSQRRILHFEYARKDDLDALLDWFEQ